MRIGYFALLGLAAAVAVAPAAMADEFAFSFNGNGISASGVFSVGQQTANSSNPPGYEITGISGTFSDTNVNVSGAITGLVTPVSYVNNPLVSGFASTSGGLSYDDVFYPAGNSPAVCYALINNVPTLTYPFSGGLLDIYGLAFNIAGPGGYVGEFWSNGDVGGGPIVYAAGLANATSLVDNPNSGADSSVPPGRYGSFTASPVPEPGSLLLLGIGLFGLVAVCARQSRLSSFRKGV
ncbi:MAG TPA: PEP-CTERM sorting domain-containing protein [Bryobacteraceae bacterium]|nr:PEP-CTERM sorting domain-containing protein [Bryobacteraceae bacterium]